MTRDPHFITNIATRLSHEEGSPHIEQQVVLDQCDAYSGQLVTPVILCSWQDVRNDCRIYFILCLRA